jgi:hypothetical protein
MPAFSFHHSNWTKFLQAARIPSQNHRLRKGPTLQTCFRLNPMLRASRLEVYGGPRKGNVGPSREGLVSIARGRGAEDVVVPEAE